MPVARVVCAHLGDLISRVSRLLGSARHTEVAREERDLELQGADAFFIAVTTCEAEAWGCPWACGLRAQRILARSTRWQVRPHLTSGHREMGAGTQLAFFFITGPGPRPAE